MGTCRQFESGDKGHERERSGKQGQLDFLVLCAHVESQLQCCGSVLTLGLQRPFSQ